MLGTIIRTALFTAVGVMGVHYLMKGMEDELDAEIVLLTPKDEKFDNGSDHSTPGENDLPIRE